MLGRDASPYLSDRARQSWRTLGYGVMAFPLLLNLHASVSTVALAMAAFVFPSLWNLVASHLERNGDRLPTAIAYQAGADERRELGTFTFRALLDKWRAELDFEDLVTEAASCSNEFGRRASITYVRVAGLPRIMREFIADLLRSNVRATDEVNIASDEEFIVCSPLLRDTLAAEVICKRLADALRNAGLPESSQVALGKAIYPMDGYTGPQLIRHAQIVARPVT